MDQSVYVQGETAVSDHSKSKQLLLFVFARQSTFITPHYVWFTGHPIRSGQCSENNGVPLILNGVVASKLRVLVDTHPFNSQVGWITDDALNISNKIR